MIRFDYLDNTSFAEVLTYICSCIYDVRRNLYRPTVGLLVTLFSLVATPDNFRHAISIISEKAEAYVLCVCNVRIIRTCERTHNFLPTTIRLSAILFYDESFHEALSTLRTLSTQKSDVIPPSIYRVAAVFQRHFAGWTRVVRCTRTLLLREQLREKNIGEKNKVIKFESSTKYG